VSFGNEVLRFSQESLSNAEKVLQMAALEVFNSVSVGSSVTGSQGTPVDTGTALNSWAVGGAAGVANAGAQMSSIKLGQLRELQNDAIYTRGLEEGRAVQRPAGWVRLTVANWQRIVSWAAQQLGNPSKANAAIPGRGTVRPQQSTRITPGTSASRRRW
jgi:hypothetical protein